MRKVARGCGTSPVMATFIHNSAWRLALWDYKTGKQPQSGTPELRSYQWQMKLYAFLYRQCYKEAPQETALYFMRELTGKISSTNRLPKVLYQVAVTEDDDDDVLEWLYHVLMQEQSYEEQSQWNPPPPGSRLSAYAKVVVCAGVVPLIVLLSRGSLTAQSRKMTTSFSISNQDLA